VYSPPIGIIDKEDWIDFDEAVPDGFSEVFGEYFDGIIKESIGIDAVVLLSVDGEFLFALFFGLDVDEGIDFFLKHVQHINAVVKHETLRLLDVRRVILIHQK
jgi:hypothetical protein